MGLIAQVTILLISNREWWSSLQFLLTFSATGVIRKQYVVVDSVQFCPPPKHPWIKRFPLPAKNPVETLLNESTASADASVEMPELYIT